MTTSNIICIHQGEDGAVCGHQEEQHGRMPFEGEFFCAVCDVEDPFVPGRKCPTCDGSGSRVVEYPRSDGVMDARMVNCPTCADSPVRGYLEAPNG